MSKPAQKCRSCGRPILWVITIKGRPMPLDAQPAPEGTVWIDEVGVVRIEQNPPPGVTRWRSHFATCPQAGTWRR